MVSEAMQKGDEVLTNGGIAGRITKVDETYMASRSPENVVISVQKNAVTAILPKGTLKKL
jgi:preprotein translocase subunit YajC